MIARTHGRPALWTRLADWARAVDAAMDADPVAQHAARLEHRVRRLEAKVDELSADGATPRRDGH